MYLKARALDCGATMATLLAACVFAGCGGKDVNRDVQSTSAYETPAAVFEAAQAFARQKNMRGFMSCLTPESQDSMAGMLVATSQLFKGFASMANDSSDAQGIKKLDTVLAKHGVSDEKIKAIQPATSNVDQESAIRRMGQLIQDKGAFVADMLAVLESIQPNQGEGGVEAMFGGKLKNLKQTGDSATAELVADSTGRPVPSGRNASEPIKFKRIQGTWLLELPMHNTAAEMAEEDEFEQETPVDPTRIVTVKITGIAWVEQPRARLKIWSDRKYHDLMLPEEDQENSSSEWSDNEPLVIRFGPVDDVQQFASEWAFGTVARIDGRTITATWPVDTEPNSTDDRSVNLDATPVQASPSSPEAPDATVVPIKPTPPTPLPTSDEHKVVLVLDDPAGDGTSSGDVVRVQMVLDVKTGEYEVALSASPQNPFRNRIVFNLNFENERVGWKDNNDLVSMSKTLDLDEPTTQVTYSGRLPTVVMQSRQIATYGQGDRIATFRNGMFGTGLIAMDESRSGSARDNLDVKTHLLSVREAAAISPGSTFRQPVDAVRPISSSVAGMAPLSTDELASILPGLWKGTYNIESPQRDGPVEIEILSVKDQRVRGQVTFVERSPQARSTRDVPRALPLRNATIDNGQLQFSLQRLWQNRRLNTHFVIQVQRDTMTGQWTGDTSGSLTATRQQPAEASSTTKPTRSDLSNTSRVWTSDAGTTVTARLKSVAGSEIELETESGRNIKLNLKRLSQADQDFIRSLDN